MQLSTTAPDMRISEECNPDTSELSAVVEQIRTSSPDLAERVESVALNLMNAAIESAFKAGWDARDTPEKFIFE